MKEETTLPNKIDNFSPLFSVLHTGLYTLSLYIYTQIKLSRKSVPNDPVSCRQQLHKGRTYQKQNRRQTHPCMQPGPSTHESLWDLTYPAGPGQPNLCRV
eukprot:CCRYP_016089-RA/>CCRYP_016089-RA protein AED:0.63 eAED:1.00 QI:0/0/0/0.66/0/0/3/0/99